LVAYNNRIIQYFVFTVPISNSSFQRSMWAHSVFRLELWNQHLI